MIEIERYLQRLIGQLQLRFGDRLVYVGLQGSYLRGEATPESDIDIMVVLENLGTADLEAYRGILSAMEHPELSCGFICSKADLAKWNPLEICHLVHSTKDYIGKLRDLVPAYSQADVRNFVRLSINNLYHEICHRAVHGSAERNLEKLTGTYKGVFFILQNLHYLNHGVFAATRAELLTRLDGKHRAVLTRSMELNSGVCQDYADSFALLFSWCQETLQTL